MGRCAILLDGAYLDRVQADDFGNAHVDIGKFGDELAGDMERLRTYYYHCMPFQSTTPTLQEKARHASMDKFIYNLKKLPRFQFRQGKLQRIGGEYKQKRVDILMAVDLVRMSSRRQIEKAVLVTGDSDLVPAVEAARDEGVVVVVYYSPNSRHDELLQACDERYEITKELIEKTRHIVVPIAAAAKPAKTSN